MIVIVDYGMGNLRSVKKAAQHLGAAARVTSRADLIKRAEKIILPGVGHFAQAVHELKKRKLFGLLQKMIKEGACFLGICIGMQLLFESSQEAPGTCGLAVIKGDVRRFNDKKLVVPHMGWNEVRQTTDHRPQTTDLFEGVPRGSYFYFVHSYYCKPKFKKDILTVTNYGVDFASSVRRDNLWGVQFHPEKSQAAGLKVFSNFLKYGQKHALSSICEKL